MTIHFSLEVFPAKTTEGKEKLLRLVSRFSQFDPEFISITCGANGSENKGLTTATSQSIQAQNLIPICPHITAIGHNQQSMEELLNFYLKLGVKQVLLLRGDQPKNQAVTSTFGCALDLIHFVKKKYPFEIYTSGYPELHPDAISRAKDLDYLKSKVDAGASQIITQFFMDPEVFFRYRDQVSDRGIKVELKPGILPILDFKSVRKFAKNCGANIPSFMDKMFSGIEPKTLDHKLLTMNILSHQITRLIDAGVNNFHLYTLNHSTITRHLCIWMKSAF